MRSWYLGNSMLIIYLSTLKTMKTINGPLYLLPLLPVENQAQTMKNPLTSLYWVKQEVHSTLTSL